MSRFAHHVNRLLTDISVELDGSVEHGMGGSRTDTMLLYDGASYTAVKLSS